MYQYVYIFMYIYVFVYHWFGFLVCIMKSSVVHVRPTGKGGLIDYCMLVFLWFSPVLPNVRW